MALSIDFESVLKSLDDDGYAIVPNIISPDEIVYCKGEYDIWKARIPNYDEFHDKCDPHGIHKYFGAGHTKFAWFIRTKPNVQNVFKRIWNTDELIVSYDGSCYIGKDLAKKDKCWTHMDQCPTSFERECIQGFVALTSNEERSLVVYKGSHKLYREHFEGKANTGGNFLKLDPDYLETIKDKKTVLKVPEGALVLWDSRVYHQNQYGKPLSEERLVQYVSFLPKSHPKNTPAIQKKRLKYLNERRTTSHWAAPIRVNALQPRHYGNERLKIDYGSFEKENLDEYMDEIMNII